MSAKHMEAALASLEATGRLRLRGRFLRSVLLLVVAATFCVWFAVIVVAEGAQAWPPSRHTLMALAGLVGAVGVVAWAVQALRRVRHVRRVVDVEPAGLTVLGVRLGWNDVRAARLVPVSDGDGSTVIRSALMLTPEGRDGLARRSALGRLGLEREGDLTLLLPPVAGLSVREVVALLDEAIAVHHGVGAPWSRRPPGIEPER